MRGCRRPHRHTHTSAVTQLPRIVTLRDLVAYGWGAKSVRHRCPHAVEYTALSGHPC
jgi:hypothetical protein